MADPRVSQSERAMGAIGSALQIPNVQEVPRPNLEQMAMTFDVGQGGFVNLDMEPIGATLTLAGASGSILLESQGSYWASGVAPNQLTTTRIYRNLTLYATIAAGPFTTIRLGAATSANWWFLYRAAVATGTYIEIPGPIILDAPWGLRLYANGGAAGDTVQIEGLCYKAPRGARIPL